METACIFVVVNYGWLMLLSSHLDMLCRLRTVGCHMDDVVFSIRQQELNEKRTSSSLRIFYPESVTVTLVVIASVSSVLLVTVIVCPVTIHSLNAYAHTRPHPNDLGCCFFF